jgi:hypothetical protein
MQHYQHAKQHVLVVVEVEAQVVEVADQTVYAANQLMVAYVLNTIHRVVLQELHHV